jgi:DNA (cytosine-5)-methyltransferase 1
MEEIKCKHVAQIEGKFEIANRVYHPDGLCPTIRTMQGGGLEPKIIEDFYKSREPREFEGVAQTLRSERNGLKVHEPIAYDEQNQYLRTDGCVGTLTTDGSSPKHNNRVVEPISNYELSDKMKRYINSYDSKYQVSNGSLVVNRDIACSKTTRECSTRADSSDYISADLDSNKNIANMDCTKFRVRKLTPKECWRLMGFDDESFFRAEKVVSNSQLYKQAGNSIVVDVLMAIFKNLF